MAIKHDFFHILNILKFNGAPTVDRNTLEEATKNTYMPRKK